MKTLKSHVIIYDAECPMCNLYTSAFIKSGMLDLEGRTAYNKIGEDIICRIDKDRARNEIALVDTEGGSVSYGLESLYKVVGHNFPIFWHLFRFKPFNFLMKKMYFFISYNRKVIVPSAESAFNACIPDLNIKYRVAFILFAWIVSALTLNAFSGRLVPLVPASNLLREFLICGGQLIFQGALILYLNKRKLWDYLGNVIAVSLIGSILLMPALCFPYSGDMLSNVGFLGYFLLVVGLLLLEHKRRVSLLNLPPALTLGWLVYRLIVLLIIL
ncbi:hypothetical protein [Sporocytophaga myxococcoides]|uniref:hypothetical protein n=1 Tax=Sporocytophaga myxococcoides TaxID=153721 RepID=UPI000413EB9C|nr:hypothetical protein [Sporocytophaga myxococcoides]